MLTGHQVDVVAVGDSGDGKGERRPHVADRDDDDGYDAPSDGNSIVGFRVVLAPGQP